MRFFVRRQRWGLSWPGWFICLGLSAAAAVICVTQVYPFLSVTARADSHYLVVEGWVHQFAIRAAVEEFANGSYEKIFTTGGPVQGLGGYINDYSTSANIGAGRLRTAGIPTDRLQPVPSRISDRDRTYSSAQALREWFDTHHVSPSAINVITEDVHARRTRLLFQKALGSRVKVGAIAVPSPDYDGTRWWRYSQGVRDVLGEGIAYLYARFFFFPPVPTAADAASSAKPTESAQRTLAIPLNEVRSSSP